MHLRRVAVLLLACAAAAPAGERIRLAGSPALSPDGKVLVFAWRGDLWRASSEGGVASRLTVHPADDRSPEFSPDGSRIAFTSNRAGAWQVFVVPAAGGQPRQVTHHSEGSSVHDWFPDGGALLLSGRRDHFWRASTRFFLKRLGSDAPPILLFDDYGSSGRVGPDGRHLLFTREGHSWMRKGYRGAGASQIWIHDTAGKSFRRLSEGDHDERWPLWAPDGKRVYLVSEADGTRNLYEHDLARGERTQLTRYEDDGVVSPALARDGSVLVYRRLFDLWRLELRPGAEPERIDLETSGEVVHETIRRETVSKAASVAFTDDGREIAIAAGGDLFVMDTELREPQRVTATPEEERDPVFSPDHSALYFVSERGGQCDLWKAERADPKRPWWRNREFELTRLTDDPQPEHAPRFTPDGRLAFTALRGDLWTMKPDGSDLRLVFRSWNPPSYDFSPDGQWVAYAKEDDDFNRDVFLRKADGSGEPFNLSRHPDHDSDPVWSPDGKLLAFTGRRSQEDSDLHYVWLRKADEDKTKRDRTLKKALEKMKGRDKPAGKAAKKPGLGLARLFRKQPAKKEKKPKPVRIDFDGLTDRIHRISIPDTSESGLMWSPDSKKLAFSATVNGRAGLYTVAPPDDLKPRLLTTSVGSGGRWLEEGKQIVWLWNGRPATVSSSGKTASFSFQVHKTVDLRRRNLAAFDVAWRTIGDHWYDPALNNRDWNAIRVKYRGVAAQTLTADELDTVVSLMLGELNGSHLGFSARESWEWRAPGWQPVTAHLGARFDRSWRGPGLRVKDVVEGTPAWRAESRLHPGELVLSVDGHGLDPRRDPTERLTGRLDRDLLLRVRGTDGKERDVTLRPTSFGDVRGKLYEQWLRYNRALVDERSAGTLGYLHVRGMSWRSFERFEAELYRIGHGKDGLVIDVRDNGGGHTTDHLLTCLTQPVHARTRARGGGPGYPQGRMVYARWSKPIVVLCNQNSFSNAEIFAHAIRTLRRGRIVGVRTAGGVISTGGTSIMEFAHLRLPSRGWFVLEDGADMELNGCRPHVTIWPRPGELPAGVDRQLDRAVELLAEDVAAWKRRPDPDPVPRSAR